MRASESRPTALAVVLLLAILALRVIVSLTYTPEVTLDQSGYEASAYRLAQNGSFAYPRAESLWAGADGNRAVDGDGRTRFLSEPRNAYTMPGYPAFRAALYMLAGDGQRWRVLTRLAQALISTLGALLTYLLARRFSERAGIIALGVSLLYQPLATANSLLLTDVLFANLLILAVYCVVRWTDSPSFARASVAGVVFGLSMWVRPTAAPWAIVAALLVLGFRRKDRRHLVAQLAVAGLIALVVICPWWIRNASLYGRFVPFSTSGNATGIEALRIDVMHQWPFPWQSSGPRQTADQKAIEKLATDRIQAAKLGAGASDLAQSDAFGEQYRRLRAEIFQRYPCAMAASRGRSVLTSLAIPYAQVEWFRYMNPLTAVLHMTILLLSVVGTIAFRRRLDAMLLASAPLFLVVVHAVIIPFNRYMFAVVPFAIILSAALIDALSRRHDSPQGLVWSSPR